MIIVREKKQNEIKEELWYVGNVSAKWVAVTSRKALCEKSRCNLYDKKAADNHTIFSYAPNFSSSDSRVFSRRQWVQQFISLVRGRLFLATGEIWYFTCDIAPGSTWKNQNVMHSMSDPFVMAQGMWISSDILYRRIDILFEQGNRLILNNKLWSIRRCGWENLLLLCFIASGY